jgi:cytoskeletal protein CcmA (bactofilin family)
MRYDNSKHKHKRHTMADDTKQNGEGSATQDGNSLESTGSTSSLETSADNNSLENDSLENDANTTGKIDDTPIDTGQQGSFMQRLIKKVNIYLLLFVFLLAIAGGIILITFLNSKKQEKNTIQTQSLSQDTLKQLATSDVTVGQPKQILSVQSNAVFAGKVLVRDSLEVAGAIQVGGSLSVPGITVSGNSIFEQLQVNKGLNVAGDTSIQGQLAVQKGLSVAGGATFGGTISAPAITVNTLQMNGSLTLTRHIIIGGSTPDRDNGPALGGGGTVALSGSDTAGSININTGTGPVAGCFITVNFTQKYNATPNVITTPIGSNAALLGYYVNRSASSFSVCAVNNPPANASFGFDYFIVE